ncbi:MAG: hypothetical protein ACTS45_00835 [Candidatus Hodgkinia cicadicola]
MNEVHQHERRIREVAASMEIVGQMPPMLKRLRIIGGGNCELRYGTSLKLWTAPNGGLHRWTVNGAVRVHEVIIMPEASSPPWMMEAEGD